MIIVSDSSKHFLQRFAGENILHSLKQHQIGEKAEGDGGLKFGFSQIFLDLILDGRDGIIHRAQSADRDTRLVNDELAEVPFDGIYQEPSLLLLQEGEERVSIASIDINFGEQVKLKERYEKSKVFLWIILTLALYLVVANVLISWSVPGSCPPN